MKHPPTPKQKPIVEPSTYLAHKLLMSRASVLTICIKLVFIISMSSTILTKLQKAKPRPMQTTRVGRNTSVILRGCVYKEAGSFAQPYMILQWHAAFNHHS
jgi:hypothetical protein